MAYASLEKPKKKHRKGLWSPDEDQRLRDYVLRHGHGCWTSVPINAGLQRNGKSCRLRWINYLRPGLKRGAFSLAEEETVLTLHQILGNKWSQIAHHLPGRTDNEIKNYWHSYLKKRVAKMAEAAEVPKNGRIQRQESSTSFESHDQMKPSQSEADEKLSLPKVFFAEWLSLDEYDLGFKNNTNASNHGSYNIIDDLIQNHATFGVEANSKANGIFVDDMLPSPLKLDCPITGNGLVDYFPAEVNIYDHDMYT